MNRRTLLATPITALFGRRLPAPDAWHINRTHLYPPTNFKRWGPYVDKWDGAPIKWEPILKGINFHPDKGGMA